MSLTDQLIKIRDELLNSKVETPDRIFISYTACKEYVDLVYNNFNEIWSDENYKITEIINSICMSVLKNMEFNGKRNLFGGQLTFNSRELELYLSKIDGFEFRDEYHSMLYSGTGFSGADFVISKDIEIKELINEEIITAKLKAGDKVDAKEYLSHSSAEENFNREGLDKLGHYESNNLIVYIFTETPGLFLIPTCGKFIFDNNNRRIVDEKFTNIKFTLYNFSEDEFGRLHVKLNKNIV